MTIVLLKKLFFTAAFAFVSIFSYSQTQSEMNEEANKDFKKVDKELNETYKKILKLYKDDTLFVKNLKAAQRIWVQFRDAEVSAKFPNYEAGHYGSMYPLCRSSYLTDLTNERIEKLKKWLVGEEEGDACESSIKSKNEIKSIKQ